MRTSPNFLFALLLFASFARLAPGQTNLATTGQWTSVQQWPYIAGHVHVLPTGEVLFWSTYNNGYYPQIWDPVANAVTPAPQTGYDLFCTGHSFLANGQLLVTGGDNGSGYGIRTTSIYDPHSGTWTQSANMNAGRWYPTNTTLANGDVLTVSGVDETGTINPLPQVWQAATGTWRDLTNAQLSQPLYPRMFLAPNGKVAYVAPVAVSQYLDASGTGTWSTLATENYGSNRDYGNAVMYDGKIFIVGGGSPPTATAEVIDLNAPTPAWNYVASMTYSRRQSNATLLPDGKILVTGGSSGSAFDDYTNPVYPSEIWDPASGQWTVVASISVYRGYHSTAALLPDGRVLSAGGEATGASYEVYSPPYLFKGARPTIASAPSGVGYGQVFFVQTPDAANISQVTWIRLSSVTHAFNQNQRLLHLTFSQTTGGLNVTSPANANISPPGDYMMFLVNSSGVPSVAWFVNNSASGPGLTSVGFNPASVTGGTSATGTVTLSGAAPTAGATVTLSSSAPGVASVPASVTVTSGATTATFPVTTTAVSSVTAVTISATDSRGDTRTATLQVNPVVVSTPAIALVQKTMTPGQYSAAASTTAQFSSPTTAHTLLVALVFWDNALATVSVTDTLGNTWKSTPAYQNGNSDIQIFYVENNNGGADQITAKQSVGTNPLGIYIAEYSGLANSNTLDVQAGQAAPSTTQSMTTPSITTTQQDLLIAFFNDVVGSGTIAPGSGWSSQGTATSFYTMWEDKGEGKGTSPGVYQGTATNPQKHHSWVGMIAAFRSIPSSVTLTSVGLSPASVTGGTSATGTVTLSGAAPTAGATVTLSSSAPGVASVPASVTVASGATTATFTATTSAVSTATSVTISGSYNGGTAQTTLQVNPVVVSTVRQKVFGSVTGTTSYPITIAASQPGSAIIVIEFMSSDLVTGLSVSDNAGGNYTNVFHRTVGVVQDIWYLPSSAGGATTVTLSWTGSYTANLWVFEVTGLANPSYDQSGGLTTASGTTLPGPALTTTFPREFLVAVGYGHAASVTGVQSPWTSYGYQNGIISAYWVATSTGTYQPTFTSGSATTAEVIAATFKAAQ